MSNTYLMEDTEEATRLDLKTNIETVKQQVSWAGLKPNMKVADLGCGAGITTYSISQMLSEDGMVWGIDYSQQRIQYAKKNYSGRNIQYECKDILSPLADLGSFDFVIIRFVLEYFYRESFQIVQNAKQMLKPDGIILLIDLDNNCLNHYGVPDRLLQVINNTVELLRYKKNFDPYVGRKLYSFLYDLNFHDIQVTLDAHHLIYGTMDENQEFNWLKKLKMTKYYSELNVQQYYESYSNFIEEFNETFFHPRRFTYTPVICCRGRKL